MRAVVAVLLVSIVAVLIVIAYDLRTIARELEPTAALSAGVLALGVPSTESHAARVARQLQLQREFRAELDAAADADRRLRASRR